MSKVTHANKVAPDKDIARYSSNEMNFIADKCKELQFKYDACHDKNVDLKVQIFKLQENIKLIFKSFAGVVVGSIVITILIWIVQLYIYN